MVDDLPVVGRERAADLDRLHAVAPLQAPDPEGLIPLADHQAAVVRQLGQRGRLTVAGEVGRRGAQHAPVVREALRVKVRLTQASDPDVNIEPLGHRIDRTVKDIHADVDLRVAEGELG